jgi:mRNA interferase RelE/StbE
LANYKVTVSKTAQKTLLKLPKRDIPKIIEAIESLKASPRPVGSRKLSGEESTYRIRQGLYRIIYEIKKNELVILILKVGHRKDIYR